MLDIERSATLIAAHAHSNDLSWEILIREDGRGFRMGLDIGYVIVSVFDDATVGWMWTSLTSPGHRTDAARSIAATHNDHSSLAGTFFFDTPTPSPDGPVDAHEAGALVGGGDAETGPGAEEGDLVFAYLVKFDPVELDVDSAHLAQAVINDVGHLGEVLAQYEQFVTQRHHSDGATAADETDWPTATEALTDDTTTTGMLGILFNRFEQNSVHEHVFYHPNADGALRRRVIASWDSTASLDRHQPFGDPDAPSTSFAIERAESVAHLRQTTLT